MIKQSSKDLYFLAARVACLPIHGIVRLRYWLVSPKQPLLIHLGCGDEYIDGFLNVDGNLFRRKDLWLDLRNGLPFPDRTASNVYCSHTLEHLYPNEAIRLLREVHRVLRPDGVARIVVPGFEHALRIAAGEVSTSWPREFDCSCGQAINYLFCDGQHRYAYSFRSLAEICRGIGFSGIRDLSGLQVLEGGAAFRDAVGREPAGSLVVELRV